MASTKVRGITIELGADTSGLSKALSGVNKDIKNTQKDLKDVERLLKLDPTNTELLAQKQRLLSDAVSETKTKLDALKQAQANIDLSTEEGQRQYDALTREIVECENQLKAAEKAAAGFNVGLEKVGATAGKISGGLSKAASATKGLSMAATGALAGLAGLAVKTGQDADELNTLAKQTGFTTAELQKMRYAAERVDVPMETITGAAAKMTKQLDSGADKFEALGVAVKDATTGEFRNVNDIFYDTIEALGKVENETERDVLAMDIFGKSANDLAGIIDDSGASLRALGEEAENLGIIIPQEQLDAANELDDAIDKVKAEATGTFASIGTEIADMLLPYIPVIAEKIEEVLEFIRGLNPETLKLIGGILAAVAALSPMLSLLSGVAKGIQLVSAAISFLLANPLVALIAAIVALVVLIATKGDEIQAKLQAIDDFLQNIFAKDWTEVFGPILGNALNAFLANIQNIWNSIKKIFDGIIDFIRGVFTGDWKRAWEGVQKIFGGIFEGLVALAKMPLNGIIGLLNMAIDGINKLITGFNNIGFDMPAWLGGGSFHPSIPTIGHIPYLESGGILTQGTAVVGENGAELLSVNNGQAIVQPLGGQNGASELTALLETYLPYLATGQQLVLDTGALVGGTASQMNATLGTIGIRGSKR